MSFSDAEPSWVKAIPSMARPLTIATKQVIKITKARNGVNIRFPQ